MSQRVVSVLAVMIMFLASAAIAAPESVVETWTKRDLSWGEFAPLAMDLVASVVAEDQRNLELMVDGADQDTARMVAGRLAAAASSPYDGWETDLYEEMIAAFGAEPVQRLLASVGVSGGSVRRGPTDGRSSFERGSAGGSSWVYSSVASSFYQPLTDLIKVRVTGKVVVTAGQHDFIQADLKVDHGAVRLRRGPIRVVSSRRGRHL